MMKKYVFRTYNERFIDLYRLEKNKIKKILRNNFFIEHVGSTAIKNMKGKGIVDIIISVPKKALRAAKEKLIKAGYIHKISGGDNERIFFEKDYFYKKKIRRVHVHLTFNNSSTWKKALLFRDYLRANFIDAKKYENLKKKAVKLCKGEGKKYRKLKNSFIRRIISKAEKFYLKKQRPYLLRI